MRRILLALVLVLGIMGAALAEGAVFDYRYAGAQEAAELLLANRDYYEGLTQNDLNFRMQKLDATLSELEALAATQTLDYTQEETAAIDQAIATIEQTCRDRGYTLPATEGIVFAKTTMKEECNAGGYTHGMQIYLGDRVLSYGLSEDPAQKAVLAEVVAHELFHCLTRNHPDFRRDMYGILGFTVVEEDYEFGPDVRERIISNPDVGHHNSYAAFEIDGALRDCAVIFTTEKPFEQPGDRFFDYMVTGLVPVDDLNTMYTSDDAANFYEVFGRNTNYVIDPEETLADNFAFALVRGLDPANYPTPEIIEAIDGYLRGEAVRQP